MPDAGAGSAPAPRRFMIACAARTGSTMLVRTLRGHPQLLMHGEVWGDAMVGLDGPLAAACAADPAARAALEALRFRDPEAAMARFLEPHGARAAGFKLKFDEMVRPEWAPLRALVEADADLGIVFLHRRDLLQRYLSHQVVLRQTGVTVVAAGRAPPAVQPFAIDVDDLLRDIARTRARTRMFEDAFAAHPQLHLTYETLAADPQAGCAQVYRFLGLAEVPVRVATEKIVRQPPQALLLNFDEVQAALRAAGEAG